MERKSGQKSGKQRFLLLYGPVLLLIGCLRVYLSDF